MLFKNEEYLQLSVKRGKIIDTITSGTMYHSTTWLSCFLWCVSSGSSYHNTIKLGIWVQTSMNELKRHSNHKWTTRKTNILAWQFSSLNKTPLVSVLVQLFRLEAEGDIKSLAHPANIFQHLLLGVSAVITVMTHKKHTGNIPITFFAWNRSNWQVCLWIIVTNHAKMKTIK